LQYIKLKDKARTPQCNTTWAYYLCWFAPAVAPADALFGTGANLSFEYAEKCWKRFSSRIKMPEHEVLYTEKGSTPYRRPPYSLVADNFLVIGDAACITNPWSGEGVPYTWLLCRIAAEVIADKGADAGAAFSKEAMWDINCRYFGGQGADFASNLAMLPAAISCTPEENDFEFMKSIIFEDDRDKGKGNLVLKLIGGLLSGGISFKSLKTLLNGATLGGKIATLYKAFPKSPAGFSAWVSQAEALWAKAPSMAARAEADLESMA
jgi:flavin-dependent dehydrogenase